MIKIFNFSGYLVLIAVVFLLLAAAAIFVFGAVATVSIIIEAFEQGEFNAEGARVLSVEIIEMIDTFLLGTVLLMMSVGLYQIFFKPHMDLPEGLIVTSLEQLKFKLMAVIIVMLAILFLGQAASELAAEDGILEYGLAIAAIMAGVALVVWVFQRVTVEDEEHIHEILAEAEEEGSE